MESPVPTPGLLLSLAEIAQKEIQKEGVDLTVLEILADRIILQDHLTQESNLDLTIDKYVGLASQDDKAKETEILAKFKKIHRLCKMEAVRPSTRKKKPSDLVSMRGCVSRHLRETLQGRILLAASPTCDYIDLITDENLPALRSATGNTIGGCCPGREAVAQPCIADASTKRAHRMHVLRLQTS